MWGNLVLLYYRMTNNRLAYLREKVRQRDADSVCIYGAGELGRQLAKMLSEDDRQVACWVDVQAYKTPELQIMNIPVKTLHDLPRVAQDHPIVLATYASTRDMIYYCEHFRVPHQSLIY